jgi:hypothetical protein
MSSKPILIPSSRLYFAWAAKAHPGIPNQSWRPSNGLLR